MDVSRRRSDVGVLRAGNSVVVSGSVWESRMKIDEVRGGIKVFNGDDQENNTNSSSSSSNDDSGTTTTTTTTSSTSSTNGGVAPTTPKMKPKQRGVGVVSNNVKRKTWNSSPIKSESLSVGVDGIKNSVNQLRSVRRVARSDGIRKPSIELRKSASDLSKVEKPESNVGLQVKSETNRAAGSDELDEEAVEDGEIGSDENCKEKEMMIPSNVDMDIVKSASDELANEANEDEEDELEEELNEEVEVEIENKSSDIKEIDAPIPEKSSLVSHQEVKVVNEVKAAVSESKKVLIQFERRSRNQEVVKKIQQQVYQKPETITPNLRKQPPVMKRAASVYENLPKHIPNAATNDHQYNSFPETHSKLQSLVDLVMWKDVSRSVFIFGIGTFVILSSSYMKDLNISFISVISYMSLVYLGVTFLFRSIICRGAYEIDTANSVVGEAEAIWLLKLVLPYLNEFLLKFKALFSGEPATTIKLAVLLFVLARCGSSITIWTMAKVGFFGVFTVPKICSLYSTQITTYAKFWGRRFRDAWDSCTHKRALTVGIFLVVWNLSSVGARVWAAFILLVAFRYYQQKMVTKEWVEDEVMDEELDEGGDEEETWERGQTPVDIHITKPKNGV